MRAFGKVVVILVVILTTIVVAVLSSSGGSTTGTTIKGNNRNAEDRHRNRHLNGNALVEHKNPFFQTGGCLRSSVGGGGSSDDKNNSKTNDGSIPVVDKTTTNNNKVMRVCNSNDPSDAVAKGYCYESSLSMDYYTEVRIFSQNWETNYISAWLLQIILSELLEVPTTIESGIPNSHELDFYDPQASLTYGKGDFYYGELVTAANVKDCRLLRNNKNINDDDDKATTKTEDTEGEEEEEDAEDYKSCYHMVPEVWWSDRFGSRTKPLPGSETPRELGALGYQSLFIPKAVIQRDPSLVSYVGLQGERNRQKLASTFKRPTTWKDYCELVSPNNCTKEEDNDEDEDDVVAAVRAPRDADEAASYYVDGLYRGHFRYTAKNNCTLNPTTCTGFFADFPCGWASLAIQQFYHLDVALESDNPLDEAGGFNGPQILQLYRAAIANDENIIVYWYDISNWMQMFIDTDYKPTRIVLPEATQSCIDARVDPAKRCGVRDGTSTLYELVGDSAGDCAATTTSLKKVIGTALKEISYDPNTPEALWSPAYRVIENFQMTSQQLGQILQSWIRSAEYANNTANHGLALRQATCDWANENIDLLQSFVPESHPRVIQDQEISGSVLFFSAMILSSLGVFLVLLSMLVTHVKRNTRIMYYAQPQFLFLLLLGLLLVGTGAICLTLPPTDASCITIAWIINIGYAVHLMPLLVRINAINNLATSGKQMQRVRLKLHTLYQSTLALVLAVGMFVLAWMLVDRPGEAFQFEVTQEVTNNEETIVTAYDYCGSSDAWYIISYLWIALLVLPAGMIAFMSLGIREDFNDTRSMGFVLLIHFLVLVIGSTMSALAEDKSDLMGYQSILLSLDVLLSVFVYIFPKFAHSGEEMEEDQLPDVFVSTTISLCDCVGFTAWSSVREPVQVFKFLEELFECMDSIAEKHHIFKVQTVGDCYVSASGIPDQRADHALCMAKFARSCMKKVSQLTKKLEVKFGPDTGDLCLRIGMHSGTVTGGFMKGKKTSFQLFGDAINVATLIKRTGSSKNIHMSEATANELIQCGKMQWITQRTKKVMTKEKGEIQTYWLNHNADGDGEVSGEDAVSGILEFDSFSDSKQRWIQWNVETFKGLLKDIVARRLDPAYPENAPQMLIDLVTRRTESSAIDNSESSVGLLNQSEMPLEDVVEIIELPGFDRKAAKRQREHVDEVVLSPIVVGQLTEYITEVANMYNDQNPFHNFAHASYVVMAVIKFMNRIKAGHEMELGDNNDLVRQTSMGMAAIHKHTYGVASDPLTLFSVVFSALIHDVNHPGVPNPQLINENEAVGAKYKNRSVAEQRSFDSSWDLLMEQRFNLLRSTICCNGEELRRFRQLVINSVMATDLGDKELKELRNSRWEKAFASGTVGGSSVCTDDTNDSSSSPGLESSAKAIAKSAKQSVDMNRKATIVIEHLIQAADVAHMSQHWGIYRKWNECLFRECYKAYREGRAEKNPADGWYKGEIGFFDFYIIPLSRKLRDCGVFGPTSDENLNYATNNRNQWEREGAEITAQMLEAVEREFKAAKSKPEQANGDIEWSGRILPPADVNIANLNA